MKNTLAIFIATASIVLSATTASGEDFFVPQIPSATPIKLKSLELNKITTICPSINKSIPVVRIQIDDINPRKIKHTTLLYDSNSDGTDISGTAKEGVKEIKFKEDYDTRLDFHAKKYFDSSDIILIQVSLFDRDLAFYPGPLAITYGNAAGAEMFCVKSLIDAKPDDRILSFYVVKVSPDAGKAKKGSFNIALIVDERGSGFSMPIVIDPKVGNTGNP